MLIIIIICNIYFMMMMIIIIIIIVIRHVYAAAAVCKVPDEVHLTIRTIQVYVSLDIRDTLRYTFVNLDIRASDLLFVLLRLLV